jgi:hypothetical protein
MVIFPAPPALLRWPVTVVVAASFVASSFAHSVFLSWVGFAILGAISLATGLALAHGPFSAYGAATSIMASACLLQIFYRGGSDLLELLKMRATWLIPARAGWIAGAAALLYYAYAPGPAFGLFTAVVWLWVLAGMLLSRPSINGVYAFAGAGFAVKILEEVTPGASLLAAASMSMLAFLMVSIAIFMVANMARAKTNQHQFS